MKPPQPVLVSRMASMSSGPRWKPREASEKASYGVSMGVKVLGLVPDVAGGYAHDAAPGRWLRGV